MLKHKYVPISFAVFGIMCAIFGFFTEVRNELIIIPSAFYLQMSAVSFLAAIYFETAQKR
ncbi:MAG: hypothetical protein WC505_05285 [Patescibacteria group bacterium]